MDFEKHGWIENGLFAECRSKASTGMRVTFDSNQVKLIGMCCQCSDMGQAVVVFVSEAILI
jgi:hypothetical protein